MTPPGTPSPTDSTPPSASPIDLTALCGREAYITGLQGFIDETNPRKALTYWLSEFADSNKIHSVDAIINALNRSVATIDHLINEQLNAIIHAPPLQALEASWRGLEYLVKQAAEVEGTKNIKIKVLDLSWPEVVKDMGRALEFDQSQLFQKIYSEEYGTPGGEPYSVLIGDYEISHRPSPRHPHDDLATLDGIAQVAAAAFAPFITSASSEFFGLDDFSTLGLPLKLQDIFAQNEYIQWRSLRTKADARFVGITLPRILMRLPYRTQPGSYRGLFFHEKPTGATGGHYLWGNACYAFAGILIREFANVGWFGHIRGVPRNQIGGGLLTNLPTDTFATDSDPVASKPVTDVIITDRIEKELSDLGFIPLCQCYDTTFAAFYSNASIQNARAIATKKSAVNAKLSAMLQHVLCGSRMAHYIKVMIRDKIGSFISAEKCEDYLRNWLFEYTSDRDDMEWEEQARYPLRRANVTVKEHPEKTGHFVSVIHLVPHYQLEQMVSELELVTELAQTGR